MNERPDDPSYRPEIPTEKFGMLSAGIMVFLCGIVGYAVHINHADNVAARRGAELLKKGLTR